MDNRPDRLVPATDRHARCLARRLSPDHLREIAETSGLPPGDAVRNSVRASLESYAFLRRDGGPVFLFGVEAAGAVTGTAMLWMLACPDISRHAAGALRACRWGVGRAFAITGAECLEQYIPEWYRAGLAFVGRLGFQIVPVPFRGRHGSALLRVTLERSDWNFAVSKKRSEKWDR